MQRPRHRNRQPAPWSWIVRQTVELKEIQACLPTRQSRLGAFTPRADLYAITNGGSPERATLSLFDSEPVDQPGAGDVNDDPRPGDVYHDAVLCGVADLDTGPSDVNQDPTPW